MGVDASVNVSKLYNIKLLAIANNTQSIMIIAKKEQNTKILQLLDQCSRALQLFSLKLPIASVLVHS